MFVAMVIIGFLFLKHPALCGVFQFILIKFFKYIIFPMFIIACTIGATLGMIATNIILLPVHIWGKIKEFAGYSTYSSF